MNRRLIPAIALLAGLGLVGTAFAQRHDDRPHGYNAQLANTQKTVVTAPAATGGRHDERPHGMTKTVVPKQVAAKPDTAASAIPPAATTTEPKSAGL